MKTRWEQLKTALEEFIQQQKGRWAVVVLDLSDERELLINEKVIFHGASVTKVLTAVSILTMIEKGEEDFARNVGDGQTIEDLLTIMINKSDNEAWDILNQIAGFKNMQHIGEAIGMKGLNVHTNELTAYDAGIFLKSLYRGRVLNRQLTEFLFGIMQKTHDETRIPQAVAPHIPVIHKTGYYEDVYHDAAIIMYEKPYVLVVFGKETTIPKGRKTIQGVSKIVYDFYEKKLP